MPGSQDRSSGAPVSARPPHRLQLVGGDDGVEARRAISVLYVEDDHDDVFLVRRQMGALPTFAVDFAHAGSLSEARQVTAGRRFDVVLCDFWLGTETTIPLIDELRLASAPSPVVLVSSLENDDIELIGRRAGAAGFVAKADLTAAALDRIFTTLVPVEEAEPAQPAAGGVAAWLRALLRSLQSGEPREPVPPTDREGGLAEALLADVLRSGDTRRDVIATLAGLERATHLGAWSVSRFDAVPFVCDGVERLRERHGDAVVSFIPPAMPIVVEASQTLFGDLVQGVFAEAADGDAARVEVGLSVFAGCLAVEVAVTAPAAARGGGSGALADRAVAAADARRLLVETLAGAVGGTVSGGEAGDSRRVTRLTVPLRGIGG